MLPKNIDESVGIVRLFSCALVLQACFAKIQPHLRLTLHHFADPIKLKLFSRKMPDENI